MSVTIVSARWAAPDHSVAIAETVEAGFVVVSERDTPEAWSALVTSGVTVADFESPVAVTTVTKTEIYERATDAEAEAIDTAVAASGARLRGLWNASLAFRSDMERWGQIVAMAEQLFGAERAAELLAPGPAA